MTNRKSHMSFRLVPHAVTFDDNELRNSANSRVISPNSDGLRYSGWIYTNTLCSKYVGQRI